MTGSPRPEMPDHRPRIDAVDGLRGWAVALVFAVHFSGAFESVHRGANFDEVSGFFSLERADRLLYWLFYSHYGVYLFFAISGFVITRAFADSRHFSQYLTFLGHRLLRIYPAFLISLVAAVLVSVHQSGGGVFALGALLQNLVFLNGAFSLGVPAYNGVTWSLFFEFVYYILFPLAYLLAASAGSPRLAAPMIWLSLILCSAALSYREWFLFLPFLAGAIAGLQPDEKLKSLAAHCRDAWLVGAYLALTTMACLLIPLPRQTADGFSWPASTPIFVFALSIVATLIIVRASYGLGFLHRLLVSTLLLALGRISFSFFLVHALVVGETMRATASYFNGGLASAAALGLATFLLSCLVSSLLYVIAEKPYYAFRRRSLNSGSISRPKSRVVSLQDSGEL